MKFWSDLEVDTLIDEISQAAYEAIEQAAGEAARAAALAALEREVVLSREVYRWKTEAETHKKALGDMKKAGRKNAIIVGLVFFLGGLAAGIGGTIYIGGTR
jgi:malate/lactate dehydrogenase